MLILYLVMAIGPIGSVQSSSGHRHWGLWQKHSTWLNFCLNTLQSHSNTVTHWGDQLTSTCKRLVDYFITRLYCFGLCVSCFTLWFSSLCVFCIPTSCLCVVVPPVSILFDCNQDYHAHLPLTCTHLFSIGSPLGHHLGHRSPHTLCQISRSCFHMLSLLAVSYSVHLF